MAVELATAYVSLAVSSKNLGKDVARSLSGTDSAAAAAGKRAGSSFSSSFGSKIVDIGKKVSMGLGVAAIGAVGYGLKVAAANEQAQISFTTMLGSAEKAGKFLKDLQAFAAKTPFEFPELQTAASSLISAGIEADKVIPIMTTLGDVTSGMGTGSEGVKRATIALQQMSAAGRITGEDLNQLRDAGIPVYDLLSKATGKSKEEVVKLAQAGKLGKKELGQMMSALESGKGLERFSGLMDKQSQSLTGMVSTFKDTLGQGLAQAVQPLIPLIKDGLGSASAALAGLMPKVAAGLKNVVTWSANLVKEWQAGQGTGGMLRDVISGIVGVTQSVVSWFIRYQAILLPLGAAIATVVAGIKVWGLVTKTLAAITKAQIAIQAAMNAVMAANPIGIVVIAIAALVAALVVAYTRSETFRNIVNKVWASVKSAISSVVNWFKNTAWPIISTVFNAIATVATWLYRNIIKPHFENMRLVIGLLATYIWSKVWPLIKTAFDKIGAAGKWLWSNVLSPAFGAIKTGVAAVGTAFTKAKDVIKTAWDKLSGIAKAPIKFIINTVINDGLIGGYNWLVGKIGGTKLGRVPLPRGFKKGGVLPGYSPGRDIHRFISPTGGILDLSGGEGILRPEITRALGGERGIAALNSGKMALPYQAHASGGVINWIKSKALSTWDWVKDKSSAIVKAFSDPLGWLKSKLPPIPGSDMISELASGVAGRATGALAGKARSLWSGFKSALSSVERSGVGVGSNARGWQQLWAIVHRILPGLSLTSSVRPGAITASGNRSYHAMGRAIDVAPPSMAAFNRIRAAFPNATELIYSPAGLSQLKNGKPYVYGEPVRSMHYNHIHLAMKKGGVVPVFDNGGTLRPGLNMVDNRTGSPEVLRPVGKEGVTVYMTVSVDDLAKMTKVSDFLEMLDNARVNGRKTARSGRVAG